MARRSVSKPRQLEGARVPVHRTNHSVLYCYAPAINGLKCRFYPEREGAFFPVRTQDRESRFKFPCVTFKLLNLFSSKSWVVRRLVTLGRYQPAMLESTHSTYTTGLRLMQLSIFLNIFLRFLCIWSTSPKAQEQFLIGNSNSMLSKTLQSDQSWDYDLTSHCVC